MLSEEFHRMSTYFDEPAAPPANVRDTFVKLSKDIVEDLLA
jgi:hypothetical protein